MSKQREPKRASRNSQDGGQPVVNSAAGRCRVRAVPAGMSERCLLTSTALQWVAGAWWLLHVEMATTLILSRVMKRV
jgi:hypothetical protein